MLVPKPIPADSVDSPIDSPPHSTWEVISEVAEELVGHYLDKVHDRPHSLFHPQTLRDRVRDGTTSHALLLAICSMGARFSPDPDIRHLEPALTAKSQSLLQADLTNMTLENIQTCILVANLCAANRNHKDEALFFRKDVPHVLSPDLVSPGCV